MDISSNLAGLSLLTGSNAFAAYGGTTASSDVTATAPLTVPQQKAKAQFTLAPTTAPWTQQTASAAPTARDVMAMASIIDPTESANTLPADVQTDFTVYKALTNLNVLAKAATDGSISASQRSALEASFQQGLSQLQTYMASAPDQALTLAFGQPTSTAKSIALPTAAPATGAAIVGNTVSPTRYAPLAGLAGSEQFTVTIAEGTQTSVLPIDLSQTPQPPTLDSVATAINAAIAAIPLKNADGSTALDASGNAVPRWRVSFTPTKTNGAWGLTINRTGNETISLADLGAEGALNLSANITTPYAAPATNVIQFPAAQANNTPSTVATIAATDPNATVNAPVPTSISTTSTGTTKTPVTPKPVTAATLNDGIAVDAQGNSYVLDTTAGTLGSDVTNGNASLALTKLDSQGNIIWQQNLGAAAASNGAAVTVAPDGKIMVAATVAGTLNGVNADGDMAVAAFNPNGTRAFQTLIRSAGADTASAITVGQDGSIYVGGQDASGSDGGFIAKLSSSGTLEQRATLAMGGAGTGHISALAVDHSGNVLALTQAGADTTLHQLSAADLTAQLGAVDLGAASGHALAVAPDGTIAIGGSTLGRVAGAQTNDPSGGQDGFVTIVQPDLSGASTSYVGTAGNDVVGSLAYLNGTLYAAGTTTGALAGARQGTTDGFLVGVDPASGAVTPINQFGEAASATSSVTLAASAAGETALSALGLSSGTITNIRSNTLVANTSLSVGDSFSIAVNGRAPIKFTIGAGDTLASLSKRLALLTGGAATITTPTSGKMQSLNIQATAGARIELIAGPAGSDALVKLGLGPTTLSVPPTKSAAAPAVTPGGRYGLGLRTTLDLSSTTDAATAAAALTQALSVTQTGYRSLYWDSTKAALVTAAAGGSSTSDSAALAAIQSQTANYQAALTRLTGAAATNSASSTFSSGDPVTALDGAMASMLSASLASFISTTSSTSSTTSTLDPTGFGLVTATPDNIASSMLSAIYG